MLEPHFFQSRHHRSFLTDYVVSTRQLGVPMWRRKCSRIVSSEFMPAHMTLSLRMLLFPPLDKPDTERSHSNHSGNSARLFCVFGRLAAHVCVTKTKRLRMAAWDIQQEANEAEPNNTLNGCQRLGINLCREPSNIHTVHAVGCLAAA